MKTKHALLLLSSLITLSACNTQQTKNTNTAAIPEATETVVVEEEYVLPSENVLVYQTYTLPELAKKSGKTLGFLDQDLTPIMIAPPAYPKKAFLEKKEGEVTAEFTVPSSGFSLKQIKILSSLPDNSFAQEALTAIEQWKFATAKIKTTKYTITNVRVLIRFKIENGTPACYIEDANKLYNFYPPTPLPCKLSNN